MLSRPGTFSLSCAVAGDDEVVLVSSIRWLDVRAEGEYQEVERLKALRLLEGLDRRRHTEARRFLAEARIASRPLDRMDDHEVWKAICAAIRDRRLVAIQKGRPGIAKASPAADQRRLVRAIEKSTRGRLDHGGRRYLLVGDAHLDRTPGRDAYVVVPRGEAEDVLADMATQPATSPALRPLLTQARAKLSKDWRPPMRPDGLVMLRRESSAVGPVRPTQEPAITPSQMRDIVEGDVAITLLDAPPFIASGHEMVTICYAFRDPRHELTAAKLQIFTDRDLSTPVWSRAIPGQHLAQESGSMSWNGKLDSSPGDEFPDGFATLAGSPYQVRLMAGGKGRTLIREVQIRVEVAAVKLEVAASRVTNARDQEIATRLQPLGVDQRIFLRVSSFARGSSGGLDLGTGRDTGHAETKAVWEGLKTPLVATVLVRDSGTNGVVAGRALGRARVLWDYVEPLPEMREGIGKDNNRFLHAIETRYENRAGPPGGRNTPVDIGGKRAPKGMAKPVLSGAVSGVVDFPFRSEECKNRPWAALGELHRSGKHEGQAGIVFLPSFISGDAYRIMPYVDTNRTLDTPDRLPDDVPHADSGWLEIWREVPVVRFVRKCADVTTKLQDIDDFTLPAYLRCKHEIPDKTETLGRAAYTRALQDALAKIKRTPDVLFEEFAMLPMDQQYDREAGWWSRHFGAGAREPRLEMVAFRTYTEFLDVCRAAAKRTGDSELIRLLGEWQKSEGADAYLKAVNTRADDLAGRMGAALAVRVGVTVAGFDGLHNLGSSPGGLTAWQKSDRSRITIMLYADRADTLAHELGHCLFLPHAPTTLPSPIKGVMPLRHVEGDDRCLMSYASERPGFCAVCLLRLRGADGFRLGPEGVFHE